MLFRSTVISLISKGTIDEHWEQILVQKLKSADSILDEDTANRLQQNQAGSQQELFNLNKQDYLNLLMVGNKE